MTSLLLNAWKLWARFVFTWNEVLLLCCRVHVPYFGSPALDFFATAIPYLFSLAYGPCGHRVIASMNLKMSLLTIVNVSICWFCKIVTLDNVLDLVP